MTFDDLLDLGEGRKDDQDKLRFDLIPVEPLQKLAEVYTIGAKKYDDRNWENGLKWGRVFRALFGHALSWWGGEKLDQEDGQHHLASVAWCAFALMEYEGTHPELDDRLHRNPTDVRDAIVFDPRVDIEPDWIKRD